MTTQWFVYNDEQHTMLVNTMFFKSLSTHSASNDWQHTMLLMCLVNDYNHCVAFGFAVNLKHCGCQWYQTLCVCQQLTKLCVWCLRSATLFVWCQGVFVVDD